MNNKSVKEKPLVSVGMPLYNAAERLRESKAIELLIEQDYENIEIIISDNGSTDETEILCRKFEKKDKRIKYFRNATNQGIIYNFNRVFELSHGKYFMWAAHDDIRSSDFISKCVEKLEANTDAVLCQTYTKLKIEGNDNVMCIVKFDTLEGIKDLFQRYKCALTVLPATAIYGLMKSSAVKQTLLFQKHAATDIAFIFELLLYGEFVQVRELLFTYYGREKWSTMEQEYQSFYPDRKMPRIYLPFLILMANHIKRILHSPIKQKLKLQLVTLVVANNVKTVFLKLIFRLITFINNKKCLHKVSDYIRTEILSEENIEILDDALYDRRVRTIQLKNWTG